MTNTPFLQTVYIYSGTEELFTDRGGGDVENTSLSAGQFPCYGGGLLLFLYFEKIGDPIARD